MAWKEHKARDPASRTWPGDAKVKEMPRRERGWSEKTNIARNEERVHQRLSCMEAERGVHLSAPRLLRKPPGTETPVNPGNKKMIKSDLMSRRRQAKMHICHSETDVTAPPSHFSLSPSLSDSLTLRQPLIHSLHSPISDVSSHLGPYRAPSRPPSLRIACTHYCSLCFLLSFLCTYNLLLMIPAVGFAIIVFICSKTKAGEAADFTEEDRETHEECMHLCKCESATAQSLSESSAVHEKWQEMAAEPSLNCLQTSIRAKLNM